MWQTLEPLLPLYLLVVTLYILVVTFMIFLILNAKNPDWISEHRKLMKQCDKALSVK